MVDLPNGKFLGSEDDPGGNPVDAEEAVRFMKCRACGGIVDVRDPVIVLAHLGPLPHPGQDAIN
jgi:hypothetical protein